VQEQDSSEPIQLQLKNMKDEPCSLDYSLPYSSVKE